MTDPPFSDDAAVAITRHMNQDHAADNVVICRVLGGQPDAVAATMTGLDANGIEFMVTVEHREFAVCVPWGVVPVTRADVRTEVVRMYRESAAVLGLE